ncbi:hypothetical protein [Ammonifex thiophilus]|uniref:Uncharacterized protein n=1 Tax=Ammonifex thiophilus TaxID=444093 RepID=A0A3D8P3P6_9THEO|nr:hypothetical protein [Ammonifex thiophilus]RDV83429.1 hypothetical protein DXX99_05420 [Ammonifex thiophilus]
MRRLGRKAVCFFTLSLLMLLPVIPAFAAENPLGDLLSSINQLVGSTSVTADTMATIKLSNGTQVVAKAGTNQNASGVTGLLSSVTGGSMAAGASVTYGDYAASASVNADWGLASSVRALGGLLASLGGALGK